MTAAKRFKEKLRHRQPLAVINADYPSSGLVEFLGHPELGLDAVMLDTEQGNLEAERIEDMARAARLVDLCVLVRVFSPDPWVIERMMLRGVDGIIVPRLDTAEQAQVVLDTVKYLFPNDLDSKIIIIQIESQAAHEDLEQFLDLKGIDVYFVGPVDLSRSMGHKGNYQTPAVRDAINNIFDQVNDANATAGTLVKPGEVNEWLERGARFLYFHVNDWLKLGANEFPFAVDVKRHL